MREEASILYIYPDHLKARATLWLWTLKDLGIVGVLAVISVFCFTASGVLVPAVAAGLFLFLTIRFEDTSILDFLRYSCAFFIVEQQFYEWRKLDE